MSIRRRAIYNRKAADQQRDICNVVINVSKSIACGQTNQLILFKSNENEWKEDWKNTGTFAVNIYDILLNSEYYHNYANMYDQIKINAVKVSVNPSIWATSRDANPSKGYTLPNNLLVVTAWDRSGLSEEQFIETTNGNRFCVLADDISTYSSSITKHLGAGSNANITRNLYPNSMNEKSQYVSCRDIVGQYDRMDSEPYLYKIGNRIEDASAPNNLLEHPSVSFKPTFLLAVKSPYPVSHDTQAQYRAGELVVEEIGTNKLYPTTFDLDFYIDVTFRGLRYNKYI